MKKYPSVPLVVVSLSLLLLVFVTSNSDGGDRKRRLEYSISKNSDGCKNVYIRNGDCVYENGVVNDKRLGKKHQVSAEDEALIESFLAELEKQNSASVEDRRRQRTEKQQKRAEKRRQRTEKRRERIKNHRGFDSDSDWDLDWDSDSDSEMKGKFSKMDRLFKDIWKNREKREEKAMPSVPCLCASESCDQ